MAKRVLIIAYYFPPVGGGGVQRTAKFVKYLPEFGWKPVVLTVKEEVYKRTNRSIDVTLLEDIPKEVYVSRTNSIDLGSISSTVKAKTKSSVAKLSFKSLLNEIGGLLINPDAQMFWIPVAVRKGLKLINEKKIDVIFSTANPWSDHIVGLILRRITGLPWIADYRDAWNLNPCTTHTSRIRKNIQFLLEKKVIKSANRIIFTSDGTKDDYKRVFGNSKFVTIRNAFDPDDFLLAKPKKFPKFTFLYAGNIPGYFKRPSSFIYVLSNLLKKYPHVRQEIMINFLGKKDEKIKSIAEENNLLDIINFLGYKSHKESIAFQLGADVLFLTLDDDIGETAIPGKLFEYLASGKPILALIPPSGKTADILRKEGRGEYIVSPRDVESIENRIMALHTKYKNGCLPIYPVENLQAYTRKNATKKLSRLLVDLKQCTR